jgi:hypothetical protein
MSTSDRIFLRTGLTPTEAARRIADTLGLELSRLGCDRAGMATVPTELFEFPVDTGSAVAAVGGGLLGNPAQPPGDAPRACLLDL